MKRDEVFIDTLSGDSVLALYKCGWCTFEFDRWIRHGTSGGNSKRQNYSSMVQCPHCKNFLKTYEAIKIIKDRVDTSKLKRVKA